MGMIRTFGLLASAALVAAVAGPALAQYGTPTPMPPQQSMGNQNPQPAATVTPATAPELIAAAVCVVGRNQGAGDALLATAPFSSAERQQAVRMINDMQRCTHRPAMTSSAPLVRGALAEATVEARFPAPQAARSPEVGVSPLLRVDQATAIPDAASFAPAYAMAECTARQHPELVRALLATEPASAEAGAAFTTLNPAFVACIAQGARLNVDGRMLRGILAENLYRWSVVQRDGAASAWAAAAPVPAAAPAAPAATQATAASH